MCSDQRLHLDGVDVLVEEGILSLELTLTTPGLLEALTELVDRYTNTADVGVGTVLTESEAQRALDSGAQYLVTPTMNLPVIELAVERQVAIFPGGLTPSELAAGWDAGATAVKVFPVSAVGGPAYVKAVRAPLPEVPLVPTGGGGIDDIGAYLDAGAAAVGLGSPLLGDAGDPDGDLAALADRARRAVAATTRADR